MTLLSSAAIHKLPLPNLLGWYRHKASMYVLSLSEGTDSPFMPAALRVSLHVDSQTRIL